MNFRKLHKKWSPISPRRKLIKLAFELEFKIRSNGVLF